MKKGMERTGLRRLAAACLSAAVLTAALWSALAAPALAVTVPKKEKAGEETFADAFRRGEIENNGGHFVRVGDRVYFRQYGKGTLDSPHVNGKFLNAGTGEGSSKITYYDASEQSVRAAFEDDGAGELYATPDGFWLERAADGPYYTDAYLVTPEGEELVSLGGKDILGISEDGRFLAVRDLDTAGDLCIVGVPASDEEEEPQIVTRATPEEMESLEYCGMYGEYMIFLACDLESKVNTLFSLSGVSGELTCLGEIEVPYAEGGYFNPALLTQQFLSDEKGIYLTAACFKGRAAALCSYVCVGAVPGEENSAYVITDITQADPDLPSDLIEVPTLDLFEPGEPEIVNAKRGTLALSKDYCGDLVYIDSPYSAWVLRKDYVKEYDYWDEDSPIEIIQDMSVIDDTAYVIRATVMRTPDEDDWYPHYALLSMAWERVPFGQGGVLTDGYAKSVQTMAQMFESY